MDLTQELYVEMPSYPTLPPFKIEKIRTLEKNGSNVSMITSMHMHIGTHIDFPLHMIPRSKSSNNYTLEELSGEGVVVDLSYKGNEGEITGEDLSQYSDEINAEDITFIFTGWSKKKCRKAPSLYKWPYLGESAAYFLVKKNIKIVAVDTFSIGRCSSKETVKEPSKKSSRRVHKIFFEAGVPIIEEVVNLDKILMGNKVARGFFIIAPMAIKGVEAAPCKVFMLSDL
jgi:arylformamidase